MTVETSLFDALKVANGKLENPSACTEAEAAALAKSQPVFLWLGYSVHGSEAGGSEAARPEPSVASGSARGA